MEEEGGSKHGLYQQDGVFVTCFCCVSMSKIQERAWEIVQDRNMLSEFDFKGNFHANNKYFI